TLQPPRPTLPQRNNRARTPQGQRDSRTRPRVHSDAAEVARLGLGQVRGKREKGRTRAPSPTEVFVSPAPPQPAQRHRARAPPAPPLPGMNAASPPRRGRRPYLVTGYYGLKARVKRGGLATIDGRSQAGRALAQARAELVAHLGGEPSVTQIDAVE